MKSPRKLLALVCLLVMAAGSAAQAQFSFDENGNFGGGILGSAPIGGGGVTYLLPFSVFPGTVDLFEAANPNTPSDRVIFNNNTISFYSLLDDPSGADLADVTPLPPALGTPLVFTETGAEGADGLLYVAAAGAPGAPVAGGGAQYHIISDVPEPGSIALLATGAGVLGFRTLRRKLRS